MSSGVQPPLAAQAHALAGEAYERAELALREQKHLAEALGHLARDAQRHEGKTDALIADVRRLAAAQRLFTEELRKVLLLLAPARKALGSVPHLEEELDALTAKEVARERRRAWLFRQARMLGRAALVGAGTVAGGALLAWTLEAFFGIHVPHLEVHP